MKTINQDEWNKIGQESTKKITKSRAKILKDVIKTKNNPTKC